VALHLQEYATHLIHFLEVSAKRPEGDLAIDVKVRRNNNRGSTQPWNPRDCVRLAKLLVHFVNAFQRRTRGEGMAYDLRRCPCLMVQAKCVVGFHQVCGPNIDGRSKGPNGVRKPGK